MNKGSIYKQDFPHLYRGIVESSTDPDNLGRCRVRVPAVNGELDYPIENLPWARPMALSPVGKGRGSVNLPQDGDIVWVMYEGANRNFPIYFGGTYGEGDLDISSSRVDFYVEGDARISYDKEGTLSIIIGSSSITVDSEGNLKVIGNLNIEGNLDIEGDLQVSGSTKVNSLQSGSTTVSSLTVTGSANFQGPVYGLPKEGD